MLVLGNIDNFPLFAKLVRPDRSSEYTDFDYNIEEGQLYSPELKCATVFCLQVKFCTMEGKAEVVLSMNSLYSCCLAEF